MTRAANARRRREMRERARQWLKLWNFHMTTAEALLTALMKLDAKQIEQLRRMVEQTKGAQT